MDTADPLTHDLQPSNATPATVRKAIILAAGVGDRLRPFTEHLPKCLAPVNGVPILINALEHLATVGIEEVVLVVGHQKEAITERIGVKFNGMKIRCIESEQYATTNNIYSLWLARDHLDEDVLLLEADVFFELGLLKHLLSHTEGSLAAVSKHQSWMSGTVVSLDSGGNIQALLGSQNQDEHFDYSTVFKTVNIYLFRGEFLRRYFVPHLEAHIKSGDIDEYYEVILHAMAYRRKHNLRAVRCDDYKWYEIDDDNDRIAAEYMFANQEQRYDFINKQHGGYWRYDFSDHAYLYNLYFPPKTVFTHFKHNLRDLVLNYPVAQSVLARLVGTLINQPPESVVVGNGAAELIKIICARVRRRLIVPVPTFNEYENAVDPERLVRFPLRAPSFDLNIEAFAAEVARSEADVAIVVTPNNPTSLAVPRDDLLELAKRLESLDCMLIVDESFVDFSSQPDERTVLGHLGQHPNLTVIKSMSKSHGICGLRIGYLVTANQNYSSEIRSGVDIWNLNSFAESFLRLAPRYRREFAASCVRVRADRDQLYEGLCTIEGMTVYKPEANFLFCRLPDDAPSGPKIARSMFVTHNIFIKDCAGKSMPDSDRYLRIAARTQPENSVLLESLKSLLASQSRSPGA